MKILDVSGRYVAVQASTGFLEGETPLSGGVVELVGSADGALRHHTFTTVYRANPYLWACVNLFARSLARFPLHVHQEEEGGEMSRRVRRQERSRAASLARALRRPGAGRSQQTLWHSTTVDRLVQGNAVWFPDRDRYGDYLGFRRIPWRYVMKEVVAGELRYWDSRKPNAKRLVDDVVHFGAGLDCDEVDNPSPIESLRATLALYDAVERHLVAYFKNAARPSGHIQVDRATGRTARKRIAEELQQLYSGPSNAGKIAVTSGEWKSITEAPGNSQVIELAKQSREEICAAYGCPPPLIGILDRAIMSNVRELRSHTARDVVGGHAVLLEGDIDAQVIARDELLAENYVEFEMAAALRPDIEARAQAFKNLRYVYSLNELRRAEGKPPIDHPDADVPWMPLNEAPIGSDNSPEDPDGPSPEPEPDPPRPDPAKET